MKTKDLCRQYGFNQTEFDSWIRTTPFAHKVGVLGGVELSQTADVNAVASAFAEFQQAQREHEASLLADAEQARVAAAQLEQERQRAMSAMLITSGFSFDGYTITKYSGYISGDDAVQVDRGSQGFFGGGVTDVGTMLMESLTHIRRNALKELKEAAYDLGCNAVIGVDFDYLTLEPETVSSSGGTLYLPYVFGVTANGNAVVIEKH